MDDIMRGNLENFVDTLLENENFLVMVRKTFEIPLECPFEKVEDMMLGYFVGRIIQFSKDAFQLRYQRTPNHEEAKDVGELIIRRMPEIKSKIKIVMNM